MSPVLERFVVERELDGTAQVVRDPDLPGQALVLRTVELEAEPPGLFEELLRARGRSLPHTAMVHDAGRLEDGRLWFVQDLVEGEQLFAWAVGKEPEALIRIAGQLLRLLAAWGPLGLVPGGRRPLHGIVVARPDGPEVVVTDPGGLVEEGARGDPGAWGGAAPERLAACRVDRRTALHELGLILHELLAGHTGGRGAGEPAPLSELRVPAPVGAEVMRLLRQRPEERPAGPRAALQALEAASGLSLGSTELPPDPPPRAPFFHSTELEQLLGRARALRGPDPAAPTLVLLRGAHGSGKRRLLDETALRLHLEGVRVLRGSAAERGQGALGPFGPLLRALLGEEAQALLGGVPPPGRWALEELLPLETQGLPPSGRPEPLEDAAAERLRVLDGLAGPFLEAARRRPLALLLTDLEGAAPIVRTLLLHLARRVAVARAWAAEPVPEGSEPPHAPQLLLIAAAGPPASPAEEAGLQEIAQGEQTAEPIEVARAAEVPEAPAIPEGSRPLAALAVVGAPLEPSFLAQALGTDLDELGAALVELRERGLVEARSGLRVAITPARAAAVKAGLAPAERAELARAAAGLIAAAPRFQSPRTRRPELALLALELASVAGPEGPAQPELLGELGPAVAAHLEALTAWEEAAALHAALAQADPEHGWQWRRSQSEALQRAGDEERAVEVLSVLLLEIGEGDPLLRADLQRRLGLCLRARGEEAGARRALERARELLGQAQGPRAHLEQARLAALLAEAHIATSEHEEATKACEAGLEQLRKEGVPGAEAVRLRGHLLGLLGHLAFVREDHREAEHMLQAGLAVAERQGLLREAARTLQRLGNVALRRGDATRAEAHWRQSLERFERIGDRRGQAHVRSSLAMAAARRGVLGEARELLQAALRMREECADAPGVATSLHNLGFVWTCAGAMDEAAATYRRCLTLRLELQDRWYAAAAASNLGQVLLDLGRAAEAKQHLDQALQWRVELGDRRGEAATLAALSELDLRRGDFGRALVRAVRAQRLRAETGDVEDEIDMLRRVARLQLALGDLRGAQRAVERSIELGLGQGQELHEGPGRLLLGEVLARRGLRDKARQELERARRASDARGDRFTSRAAQIELAALQLAAGNAGHAKALLDSRPVPRPGRMQPLAQGAPDRHGVLRVRERLLRARIELARDGGSPHVAARCAEEALEAAQEAELRDLEWRARYALAATFELRGSHEEALAHTVETQERVEELQAAVPPEHRETWLHADPVRAAALRGDSPLKVLGVDREALGRGGQATELVAMLELKAPRIEPARQVAAASGDPRPRAGDPDTDRVREAEPPRPVEASAPVPPARPDAPERHDLAVLARLNRTLVDEADVRRAWEALLQAAVSLTGAERAFLGLFEAGPEELRLLAQHGLEEVARPRERFTRRCAWKAADTGQLVLSADVRVAPEVRARAQVLGLGLRTVLAAPVRVPGGRRGALYLDCAFSPDRFGPREVELVEVLADQCALALCRATLEGAISDELPLEPEPALAKARPHPLVRVGAAAGLESGGGGLRPLALVGRSAALQNARQALEEFTRGSASLLIEGPPGVGKGTLARAVHAAKDPPGPLVVLDLRDVDPERAERELFGQVAGAGEEARPGLLRQADGGTLLLERLEEAPLAVQDRLVAALDARAVTPLGGAEPVPFSARVVATASDADDAALRGALRPDLLALVSQLRVTLPPLDERPDDKGPILDAILAAWEPQPAPVLPPKVRAALEARHYPGNVRELQAVLRAAAARAPGRPLQPSDLPAERPAPSWELAPALLRFEKKLVQGALRAHGGDLTATAKALGVSRRALQTKLEQLGIAPG